MLFKLTRVVELVVMIYNVLKEKIISLSNVSPHFIIDGNNITEEQNISNSVVPYFVCLCFLSSFLVIIIDKKTKTQLLNENLAFVY
jgi:hypothetical protein